MILVILILLAGGGLFWLIKNFVPSPTVSFSPSVSTSGAPSPSLAISPAPTFTATLTPQPPASPQSILLEVSFFAQAPFGEWSDPIFQDGCEEAAAIMAMSWVQGAPKSKEQAKNDIIAITQFEDKTYGAAPDRSAQDTAGLMKDYYGYQNIEVRSGVDAQDLKTEILKGSLLIVPVNGRILKNPFYTPPGPEHHMIVIVGYDARANEFITNDIGTRHGEKYHYGKARLGAALQDYPTGDHLPSAAGATAMIVVRK